MLSIDKEADITLIYRHLDTIVQKYGVDEDITGIKYLMGMKRLTVSG